MCTTETLQAMNAQYTHVFLLCLVFSTRLFCEFKCDNVSTVSHKEYVSVFVNLINFSYGKIYTHLIR